LAPNSNGGNILSCPLFVSDALEVSRQTISDWVSDIKLHAYTYDDVIKRLIKLAKQKGEQE
jgi:hypothetical protein